MAGKMMFLEGVPKDEREKEESEYADESVHGQIAPAFSERVIGYPHPGVFAKECTRA
jgi:hypothetical protein